MSKKLSKEATPEELEKLQSILLSNPDLHHQADLLIEMWQQEANITRSEDEAAYMRHIMKHKDEFFVEENPIEINSDDPVFESTPGSIRTLFSKRRLTVLSFIAFIVLATGTIYLFTRKEDIKSPDVQAISSIVTKNGNRTKIVLPDGSQVWLNAGSNLDYNNSLFNKNLREVTLNGEAYFEVTKNAEKPFIIHTKKMDIKVIGTAFNVRSYNDENTAAEASLIRGSIEVTLKDRKDLKITLKPNQKISIPPDEAETTVSKPGKVPVFKNARSIPPILIKDLKASPTYNIIPEIAWTQNKLFFEDESLENIAPMMERWFGKRVVISNQSLKSLRYYGNFENETIEEVLSYLKLSKPFNFKFEHDSVVIY